MGVELQCFVLTAYMRTRLHASVDFLELRRLTGSVNMLVPISCALQLCLLRFHCELIVMQCSVRISLPTGTFSVQILRHAVLRCYSVHQVSLRQEHRLWPNVISCCVVSFRVRALYKSCDAQRFTSQNVGTLLVNIYCAETT